MSNTKIPSVLWNTYQSGVLTTDDIARAKANIGLESAVVLKGNATVAQLNSMTQDGEHVIESGLATGWQFTMSDSGTLRSGSLVVSAGDKVVWNGGLDSWRWEMAGGGGKIKIYRVTKADGDEWNWPDEDEVSQLVRAGTYPILVLQPGQDYEALHAYTFEKSESAGSYRYMYFSCLEENKVIVSTYRLGYSPYWNIVSAPKVNDTAIAPEYSSSNTYTNGELCMREGKLYACTVIGGITTPEAWNSNHWAESQLVNQVAMANIAVIGYNPYMSPPDQTILGSIVTAINERKEVVVYHSTTTYPFYYRYSHSQADGPTWNKLYYFYSFHDLNQQLLVTDVRDSSGEHVSYTVNIYTKYRYVEPNMIAPQNSTYYAYTPNDLTVDGSVLRRCIEQTVAEDPYDYTKWELTDVDKELKSRAYIIHAKYDAQDNIIGPTREEMDNINLKGAVILDIECYTGGVDPSTGKKWTPELHEKYMMTYYVAEGASTTYSSGSVYYFRCMETWKIDGTDTRATIIVPHDDGTAPAPTVTISKIPIYEQYQSNAFGDTPTFPSKTEVWDSYQCNGLPVIHENGTLHGANMCYVTGGSSSGLSFRSIPFINENGHYEQIALRDPVNPSSNWDATYQEHQIDCDTESLARGPYPETKHNKTHIMQYKDGYTANTISISKLVNGKLYQAHCMVAGQRLALVNDTSNKYSVYDNAFSNSSGTIISTSPYDLGTTAELELWTANNTHGVTAYFMVTANNVLYVSYGY